MPKANTQFDYHRGFFADATKPMSNEESYRIRTLFYSVLEKAAYIRVIKDWPSHGCLSVDYHHQALMKAVRAFDKEAVNFGLPTFGELL